MSPGSIMWHMGSEETKFPFFGWNSVEPVQQSNTGKKVSMKSESAFDFAQNKGVDESTWGPFTAPRSGSRFPWTAQQMQNSLQDLRLKEQDDGLSKLTASDWASQIDRLQKLAQNFQRTISNGSNSNNSSNDNSQPQSNSASGIRASNPGKDGNSESSGSTDSLEAPSTSRTGPNAVGQKNHRNSRHGQHQQRNCTSRTPKTYTATLTVCCPNPKLRLTCECCNEELSVKQAKEELKPRVIPVATSQLGFCRFCQSNGDPAEVYQSHSLRSDDGKVSCPVLREYSCPICNNGGGDYAHTIKYCPLARKAKPGHHGSR